MKKLMTTIVFIIAAQALATNTTIHGIGVKNWTALDSLCFEVDGRFGGSWYTRQMTFKAIKNLLYDPDSALTTTRSSSIGLYVKVAGLHRWHMNADLVDGSTLAFNASHALYIPTGGVSTTQVLDASLTGTDMAEATISPSRTKDYLWKYTSVTNVLTEQTYTTATTMAFTQDSLDSGQSALSFTDPVDVQIIAKYQERGGAITTKPTVSGGKVTWGFTLDPWGNDRSDGTVHFDFLIKQL